MTVNGKMFCSNTNLVSSSRRIHTTPLLNFSFAQVIERITLITLFDNQYNFPSFQILPPARFIAINIIHPLPGITRISRALDPQLGPQYRQVYFSLPVDPSFHHRAIESCPRSGTRALFCLAISPRESLMRNNIGQAVLSRLTAFIRPEIARETTNNCAVYQ